MITIRRAGDRGRTRLSWLDSRHTFSFGEYYDPKQMGFRSLRVINDDRVEPGGGFATHGHRDMEIITYVLEGALEHKDSLGTGSVIYPGEVQRMSAGTGITHSEFNHSRIDPVHFLQIWILPAANGLSPGYEQRAISDDEKRGRLRLVAGPDGQEGTVTLHQAVEMYTTLLEPQEYVSHRLMPGHHGWLHVARGSAMVNGQILNEGDGLAASDEPALEISGQRSAEVLMFELA